ncbi:MAG: secretion protein HlyD, partial [Segetibacter sp.]|nr:secretion protein HlyD [Segetibacter sp.]
MDMQANEKKETITKTTPAKPKRSKVFPVILLLLILGGAWFGISKYNHGKHHEETDDAQVESNISPVIPRVSGYVAEVRVKDNQRVHKGDTLLILDQRDLRLKVEQSEAALATAQSNLGVARTSTSAAQSNIAPVQAS